MNSSFNPKSVIYPYPSFETIASRYARFSVTITSGKNAFNWLFKITES